MYSPERRQGSGRTTLSPLPGFNPPWPLSSSSGRLQPPLPGVLQPFAIILLEQVAHDDTAGSLIGRRCRHRRRVDRTPRPRFRQHPAAVIGVLIMGPRDRVPNLLLPEVVIGDRKCQAWPSSRHWHRIRAGAARRRSAAGAASPSLPRCGSGRRSLPRRTVIARLHQTAKLVQRMHFLGCLQVSC